jgi:two-component system sensor histidine kinase YesM
MFLAAGILMALSAAIFLGRGIARPMNRLTRIMRSIEGGDLDVEIPEQGFSEIADLASAFRRLLGRIKLLMHQNAQEQEQKRLYELDALQAQINPHFLYNTLDSIVWMQERGQNQDAILMVTALARLFRISISKGRSIISVAEELEHVRNYLIIQSIRFKNKFTYSIDAEPEALKLRTVKLILQPLVENAIVHGFSHFATDEGRIEISARVEDDCLVMRVRDNGLGMNEETVKTVLIPRKAGGIGLRNVHERIALTFGDGYGLTLESELDEGTLVTTRQPASGEEGLK